VSLNREARGAVGSHQTPVPCGMSCIATTLVASSGMGGRRIASTVAAALISSLGFVALALPATAHPSDFETLTLDLLVGPRGLEVLDAAVVESKGPGYEPFPTSDFKRDVAVDVLDALHLALGGVSIDAEMSERYHEVGFGIRFEEPALGVTSPLTIETADLQRIVADRGLSRLKLSVCGVTAGADSSDQNALSQLGITASHHGRRPAGLDREACEIWALTPTDQSVSIVIEPQTVAETGLGLVRPAVAALSVLFMGAALLTLRSRIRR
jgi:hypothetical protein